MAPVISPVPMGSVGPGRKRRVEEHPDASALEIENLEDRELRFWQVEADEGLAAGWIRTAGMKGNAAR